MRRLLPISTALLGAFISMHTQAQTQTQTASANQVSGTSGELDEIVVTAQRRSENLQSAALAVDVVSGSALIESGITSPLQLGAVIPSLAVQQSGGANTIFFLRGVGNFTTNGYGDPAIAFNYDGVYVGRPTSTAGVLYDLERVEVLKGPQGTLYGRNATAGAINVIPARPRIGETSGSVDASYGNYDAITAQGAINLPIGTQTALRVSGSLSRHDGYLSDGANDDDTVGGRVQLLQELTPALTVRLALDYAQTDALGGGASYDNRFSFNRTTGQYTFVPSGLDRSVGLLDPASQAYRQQSFAGLPGRNLGPLENTRYQDNKFYGLSGDIEYDMELGTLTVIPAFRSATLDNRFTVNPAYGFIQEKDKQYSLEARFAGKRIGMFDYMLGGYYFDEKIDGNYTFSQDALAAYQDFRTTTKSPAFFGRITANLNQSLRLVGGARYTRDVKRFDGLANVITVVCTVRTSAGVPSCPAAPVLPVTDSPTQLPFTVVNDQSVPIGATGALAASAMTPVNKSLKTNKMTYRAALEYDLSQRSLFYASYETGFRSGGFSLSFGRETFQPEYLTAYTIGSKNRLFDNRLQLNAEAFLWRYRDQQISHTGIDARGNQGNFTDNVGRATNKGIEVETRLLLTPNTLLGVDMLYLDARYKSFIYQVPLGTSPPAVGCPVTINAANPLVRDVDCSGKPAYKSPKWTVNLNAQQTFPLSTHKFVFKVDTQYKSSRYVAFEYLPFQRVGKTWESNAKLDFGPSDDRWSVGAFVRNIENERVLVGTTIFPVGSLATALTGAPRTYGIRFGAIF